MTFHAISQSDCPYEALVETRVSGSKRRANSVSLLFLIALAVGLCCLMPSRNVSTSESNLSKRHDEHTIPTPLSVVDPGTGHYLYALNVPLYDRFRRALMQRNQEQSSLRPQSSLKTSEQVNSQRRTLTQTLKAPELSLDRSEITVRQPLTLSWTPGQVKDEDILSLHCPHDNPNHIFQDAATLSQVRATSRKHGGRHPNTWYFPEFPVFRQETCQFRLFQTSDNGDRVHLLATSPVLKIRDSPRTPTGIHLTFSNDTTQMVVQFVTGEEGTPVAMYGLNETTTKVEGTSHTYAATDMCQEPANVTETGKFQVPGMLHVVTLTNLEPDTDYQYKVGLAGGQGIVWSDTFQFHSSPPAGDTQEFSYVVYGDQGCPSVGWGQGGVLTAAMAARESNIRAVHHFGDLSYARGAAHIWDEWFHMIQSFAARVPLLIGVGNHEYDHTAGGENGKDPSGLNASHGFQPDWGNMGDDSGGECGVPTARRFTMPVSNGSNGVFWYSHEYASVHTTVISSEHNLTQGITPIRMARV